MLRLEVAGKGGKWSEVGKDCQQREQHSKHWGGRNPFMLDSEGSRCSRRGRQSQIMQGLVSYGKDPGCYLMCSAKPLEGFQWRVGKGVSLKDHLQDRLRRDGKKVTLRLADQLESWSNNLGAGQSGPGLQ